MENKIIKPTDGEIDILNILWEKGPSTVRDIHQVLELTKGSAYTTTLKLMQIMSEKGLVKRDTTTKTHIYEAAVSKDQTQKQIVQRMIDSVFKGSAMQMVMQALGNKKTDPKELEQIKEYLRAIEQQQKSSSQNDSVE